jgi:nucleoid DNA-binding protein
MRWTAKCDQASLEAALRSNCGISDEQAHRCVTAVWDHTTETLRWGNAIQLRGVGTWSTRPSRKPGRRNVRFAVSRKILDEADKHRPPADPKQFEERSLGRIAQAVERLIGTRPGRYVLENLLDKAGYDQQKLLAALTDLIRSGRFYSPEDLRLFIADVSCALARRSRAS